MDEQAQDKKPHWAWPHVVAVAVAIAAFFVVYRYTGDSDLLYTAAMAAAMGGGAWVAAWAYLFRGK